MPKPEKTPRRGLSLVRLADALLFAPFAAFLLVFGHVTGTLNMTRWPPQVDMSIRFWGPAILCGASYLLVLKNLADRRRGRWKWYREGVWSVVIVIMLWATMAPQIEMRVDRAERAKAGFDW